MKKKKKSKKYLIIFVSLIILAFLAGLTTNIKFNRTYNSLGFCSDTTSELSTYKDEYLEFQYPSDWNKVATEEGRYIIESPNVDYIRDNIIRNGAFITPGRIIVLDTPFSLDDIEHIHGPLKKKISVYFDSNPGLVYETEDNLSLVVKVENKQPYVVSLVTNNDTKSYEDVFNRIVCTFKVTEDY